MGAFFATSDAMARALRRHARRHGLSRKWVAQAMGQWVDRRRTPRQVWHAAAVCELQHAMFIREFYQPASYKPRLRAAIENARKMRKYAGPSPLPGSHFMTYGA